MRKYKAGIKIQSTDEIEKARIQKRLLFDSLENKAVNPKTFDSWNFRSVKCYVKSGKLFYAERIEN